MVMKRVVLQTGISFLLLFMMGAGCTKDGEEWVQVDSLIPDAQLSSQLNSTFTENNACLLNFQKDTVFHVIYNKKELAEINICNTIPDVDFDKCTLIVGKIMVSSISDNISEIILTSNDNKAIYNIEISIFEPDGRYGAIGNLFFWRIFPRLKSGYDFKLLVTNH